MENLYTVLWAVIWPWSVFIGLGYLLFCSITENVKRDQQLKQREEEVQQFNEELTRQKRILTDAEKRHETALFNTETRLRDRIRDLEREIATLKNSSLAQVLNLKGES